MQFTQTGIWASPPDQGYPISYMQLKGIEKIDFLNIGELCSSKLRKENGLRKSDLLLSIWDVEVRSWEIVEKNIGREWKDQDAQERGELGFSKN
jgi:hypothetical protein